MKASLDHIGIYVKDLERSLKFYSDLFGFPEHSKVNLGTTKITFLDLGGSLLEIVQRAESPEAPSGSWSHLAYTTDDFDGMVGRLKARELELREMTLGDGSRIVFFKDPDGHDVEIDEKAFNK
jgi:catechol 2,3-dioxygenase-like lactoylglutathione lyase family enzyme